MYDLPSQVASRRSHHRLMLALALLVIPVSWLLEIQPNERVSLQGLSAYPLPPLCASRTLFGVDCPGCGLTRSFVCLAHGDWAGSFARHRLGWLMAVAVALQIPYRTWALRTPDQAPLGRRLPALFGYAIIAALVANWLFHASGLI